MRRLFFAFVTATTALVFPDYVLAAGGPILKPPVSVPALTAPSAPRVPAATQGAPREQFFGGCGGRRVRDPHTNQCRGPAEVGR